MDRLLFCLLYLYAGKLGPCAAFTQLSKLYYVFVDGGTVTWVSFMVSYVGLDRYLKELLPIDIWTETNKTPSSLVFNLKPYYYLFLE